MEKVSGKLKNVIWTHPEKVCVLPVIMGKMVILP